MRASPWTNVPDASWRDWRWHLHHRLRTAADLERVLPLTNDERAACAQVPFPVSVTPYYASLIDPADPNCPIRAQAVPRGAELTTAAGDSDDPLAEEAHEVAPGLTHRYPDRALLYTTHACAVYCRHCNRRRKVGNPASAPSRDELGQALAYLRSHREVRDLLVSGGDPLSLSDDRLATLLGELRRIEHLEIIRLATRMPVTLPQRITPVLAGMVRAYHPLYVSTHFNHERECTSEAGAALSLLADAGVVLNNQMVLLKGVNDDAPMVRRMNQWLLKNRCRPYYIFQCDAVNGVRHFRTPVEKGLAIIDNLRGWTSGLAVPHYVVDLPGGGGKVSLQPDYLKERKGATLTFRNYAGGTYSYEDG